MDGVAGKHLIVALPRTRLDRGSGSAFFAPVTSALGATCRRRMFLHLIPK